MNESIKEQLEAIRGKIITKPESACKKPKPQPKRRD